MKRIALILALALVGGVFAATYFWKRSASNATALRALWELPDFSLTERSGKTVSKKDLLGKVWVASFIFTTCSEQCPMITSNLKKLDAKAGENAKLKLVSFSVDPKRDTPAKLAAYADKLGANSDRWLFLTGAPTVVEPLIQKGFKVSAVEENSGASITHSSHLVLVDARGQVRGYYDGMDEHRIDDLSRDIQVLSNEIVLN